MWDETNGGGDTAIAQNNTDFLVIKSNKAIANILIN